MDAKSLTETGLPVTAYPRSAIEEFLADAAAEQSRLEAAIADARTRERRATHAAEESEATTRLLRSSLHDLRQELAERRRAVEDQVETMVTDARVEAASILADARRQARSADARAADPADGLSQAPSGAAPLSSPPAPPLARPAAGLASPIPAPASPSGSTRPHAAPPPEPTTPIGEAIPPAAPLPAPAFAPVEPGPASPPVPAPGKNGHHAVSEAAEVPEIDLTTTDPAVRSTSFGSLLRRGRHRAPESDDTSNDEFLDFLRGALLDDGPLPTSASDERDEDDPWKP